MHLFDRLSIKAKVFGAWSVLLIAMSVIGSNAYFTSDRAATDLKALTDVNLTHQQEVAGLQSTASTIHLKLFRYVTWASNSVSDTLLTPLSNEIQSDLDGLHAALTALSARPDLTLTEASIVNEAERLWLVYAKSATATLGVGSVDPPMATMMLGGNDDEFRRFNDVVETLAALASARTADLSDAMSARANWNMWLLIFGGVVGILLMSVVAIAIGRSIIGPIEYVTHAMQQVSTGATDFGLEQLDRGDEIGQMLRAIRSFRDNLQTQNTRFDAALAHMSQGLAMYDNDQRLLVCNSRYSELYGFGPKRTPPGTPLREILEARVANGHFSGVSADEYIRSRLAPVVRPTTEVLEMTNGRSILVCRTPMAGGGWVTTHDDITERREADAKIAHMAHHDGLTGLPNRVRLLERLEEAVAQVKRGEMDALLYIDLDHFKTVNDTMGHLVGDQLLKAVADRIRKCVREVDTVARLGGDEFAVIQRAITNPDDVAVLVQRIQDAIKEPCLLDGNQVVIDSSIGLAVSPSDGDSVEELLKNADLAAYAAKADGRGTYRFFEPEMDQRIKYRRKLELDLRSAVGNDEFVLHYQPIVNLQTNEITSLECLIRWLHPERGMVAPGEFIPIAEDTGLIVPIGEWVLRRACADAMDWPGHVKVAVNLSPVQLNHKDLFQTVVSALADSGLPADRLEFEITETVLMQNTFATLSILRRLRSLGIRFAMDDFGTGYSSLSYLRSFPFDKIKIDRSFLSESCAQENSLSIIKGVRSLAESLNMTTTMEGIETDQQLEQIRAVGCDEMQGFLFSRPKAAQDIVKLFRTKKEASAA